MRAGGGGGRHVPDSLQQICSVLLSLLQVSDENMDVNQLFHFLPGDGPRPPRFPPEVPPWTHVLRPHRDFQYRPLTDGRSGPESLSHTRSHDEGRLETKRTACSLENHPSPHGGTKSWVLLSSAS